MEHLTRAFTIAWLPPRGNSRQAAGLYHSLNMNATSAAMVPSAGRPVDTESEADWYKMSPCAGASTLSTAVFVDLHL